MDESDYEKYTIDGLKRILKTYNQPLTGNKPELIQRLRKVREADATVKSLAPPSHKDNENIEEQKEDEMKDNEEERKVRGVDATVISLAPPSCKDDENKEKGKECETKENELQGNHYNEMKDNDKPDNEMQQGYEMQDKDGYMNNERNEINEAAKINVNEKKTENKVVRNGNEGNNQEKFKQLMAETTYESENKEYVQEVHTITTSATKPKVNKGISYEQNLTKIKQDYEDMKWDLMMREVELLKRELRISTKENEILNMTKNEKPADTLINKNIPFTHLKDLVSEFDPMDGDTDIHLFKKQIISVQNIYQLDDHSVRALISNRLKGKASKWLQSCSESMTMPVNELLYEMENIFDNRESQLVMKRKFEKKIWQSDESFQEYFYEKLILSNKINISQEELLGYALRNQAKMQRF